MSIGQYSFEEYLSVVKSFHGYTAPGLAAGGVMVDLALSRMPGGVLFEAVSETRNCLPDAIQLLTPCTVGNGWLKIMNLGRFALSLYDKLSGEGVRVFFDAQKVRAWPQVEAWLFKLKTKQEQDGQLVLEQIRQAGPGLYGIENVCVQPQFLGKRRRGGIGCCNLCGEPYPVDDGAICRACAGETPYLVPGAEHFERPFDGRKKPSDGEWIHANEAAIAFATAMAGEGVRFIEPPGEGKINFVADRSGLFVLNEECLEEFNMIAGMMCASRRSFTPASSGRDLAATMAIPLYLPKASFLRAITVLRSGPLFRVLPMRKARVGILVTGIEVFPGPVKDRFIPIIRAKVESLNCRVVKAIIAPGDRKAISGGVRELLECGTDLLVATAGLSADPDDVTRQGLLDAGATDMLYGAPVLPGAITLLARIGSVQVMGIPACALHSKITGFDLLFPRLLAGLEVSRRDLAKLGHGSFCLECKTCTFPKCPFGG
ncbi:MAG: FmdE family protein [Syntrophobacteraceae bacterium]